MVAPRVAEVEPAASEDVCPGLLQQAARLLEIVHHQPEVARAVGRLGSALREHQELVAHVDKRHPRHPPAQLELEQLPVEAQPLLDVPDLEHDVVDADETGTGERLPPGRRLRIAVFATGWRFGCLHG